MTKSNSGPTFEDEALSKLDFGFGSTVPRSAQRNPPSADAGEDAGEDLVAHGARGRGAGSLLLRVAAELPMIVLFLLMLLALNLLLNPDATVGDLAAHAAAGIREVV